MPKLQLIAHRGYAAQYPENTLPALQAAVMAGALWLEFDVQLSSDLQPVLLHDADLRRTAGLAQSVFDVTAAELATINVGEPDRFAARYADVTVPTLASVCAWLKQMPDVQACVEIKTESIERYGAETVFAALWPLLAPVRDQVVLISYDDAFLFAARTAQPQRIGWVAAAWDATHYRRARLLAPDMLFSNWTRLPPAPEPLWQGPWQWAVYEVTDPAQALQLAARGIPFIESMAVGELLQDARLREACGYD